MCNGFDTDISMSQCIACGVDMHSILCRDIVSIWQPYYMSPVGGMAISCLSPDHNISATSINLSQQQQCLTKIWGPTVTSTLHAVHICTTSNALRPGNTCYKTASIIIYLVARPQRHHGHGGMHSYMTYNYSIILIKCTCPN